MAKVNDPDNEDPAFPGTPARSGMPAWYPETLASVANLKELFPEALGYSPRNPPYTRSFAEAWPDLQEVAKGCCNFAIGTQLHVL